MLTMVEIVRLKMTMRIAMTTLMMQVAIPVITTATVVLMKMTMQVAMTMQIAMLVET